MKKIIFSLMIFSLSLNLYALTKNEKLFLNSARFGDIETVKELINSEIDIDIQDQEGFTALMYASALKKTFIVMTLLDYGADRYIKNDIGETAIDMAKNLKNYEIIGILESYE